MTGPDDQPAPGAAPSASEAVPPHQGKARTVNLTLIAALAAFAVWVVLAFVAAVPAGWVHVFLAVGVILLIRRVVTGPAAW